jgi:hypothetical protein
VKQAAVGSHPRLTGSCPEACDATGTSAKRSGVDYEKDAAKWKVLRKVSNTVGSPGRWRTSLEANGTRHVVVTPCGRPGRAPRG